MLTIIQKYIVNWYHTYLLYPVIDCTESTIGQHYYCTNLRDKIHTHIKFFKTCQKKKQNKKYSILPAK